MTPKKLMFDVGFETQRLAAQFGPERSILALTPDALGWVSRLDRYKNRYIFSILHYCPVWTVRVLRYHRGRRRPNRFGVRPPDHPVGGASLRDDLDVAGLRGHLAQCVPRQARRTHR
jgi:hypothetical protein